MRETPTIAQTELGQRMRPGIPWSIKGVEPQAREAAKIAARRAGMTLGEWLNTVLLDADDFAPEPDYRPPHRAAGRYEAPRYGPEVHERLDDLATQIGRLAQRQADTAVSRVVEPKIDLNPLSDLVRGLVDRMERSEKRSVDSMEEFDRRLNRLSDKLIHDIGRGDSAGTAGTQGFERALKNIVDHIEQNERRHSESFKSIQSKIGELATRLTAVPAEATRPNAQLLSGLERRLAELGDRIDRMERRSQDSSPVKVIEDRLGHLVEQVREQAQTVSSMARSREGTAAVDTASFVSRNELQKIQSRIEEIVNRLEDPVHGNPDAAIAQMQDEIASSRAILADVRIEAASIQDMRALRQAIDGISAQLADGSPLGGAQDQAIAQMQDEIAALSQSIAAMSAGSASGQDVDDIREGLRQVAEQIQYLQASGGGSGRAPARRDRDHQRDDRPDSRRGSVDRRYPHPARQPRAIGIATGQAGVPWIRGAGAAHRGDGAPARPVRRRRLVYGSHRRAGSEDPGPLRADRPSAAGRVRRRYLPDPRDPGRDPVRSAFGHRAPRRRRRASTRKPLRHGDRGARARSAQRPDQQRAQRQADSGDARGGS
jgi:ElaB/YqjD/DUF883 family membrane-anchored ribosome-binding protein